MSISFFAGGQSAIAAQDNVQPATRKPPHKRQITAKADSSETPEPR